MTTVSIILSWISLMSTCIIIGGHVVTVTETNIIIKDMVYSSIYRIQLGFTSA